MNYQKILKDLTFHIASNVGSYDEMHWFPRAEKEKLFRKGRCFRKIMKHLARKHSL